MTSVQLGTVPVSGMTPREGYFNLGSCLFLLPTQNNQAPKGTCSIVGCHQPNGALRPLHLRCGQPPCSVGALACWGCISSLRLGASSGQKLCHQTRSSWSANVVAPHSDCKRLRTSRPWNLLPWGIWGWVGSRKPFSPELC